MRLRFLALALLAACESPGGTIIEPPEVILSTDPTVQRDAGTGIALAQIRVFNQNRFDVALVGCDGKPQVAVDRRTATGWENAAASICPANRVSTPVKVEGRSALTFTVGLAATGSYRVAGMLASTGDPRHLVSNEFEVR